MNGLIICISMLKYRVRGWSSKIIAYVGVKKFLLGYMYREIQ
jgi:hypothetical protein